MTTETKKAIEYETVIGLEVHVQLQTRSKMFCRCSADYADTPPNTHVCPVCMGMPGRAARHQQAGRRVHHHDGAGPQLRDPAHTKFDRKNYPYPDLMKGYQISQYDMPLSRNGWLEVEVDGARTRIGITRVHLEEDMAKLVHRRTKPARRSASSTSTAPACR